MINDIIDKEQDINKLLLLLFVYAKKKKPKKTHVIELGMFATNIQRFSVAALNIMELSGHAFVDACAELRTCHH